MAIYSRKITFYQNIPASDGSGGFTDSWLPGAVIWADIEVANNARIVIQGQEQYTTVYMIHVRAQSFNYIAPVTNYRIDINAFGITRTLKIINTSNPDLLSYDRVLQCIESNE